MIYNKTVSLQTAEYLLGIKAVKLSPHDLFTWASGIKSPIYCDNRITLSFPAIRTFIKENFVNAITEKFEKPDLIAGVATGGIPQGALVAEELSLPFVYVRTSKKDHGLTNLIEGRVEPGQKVVVVEDLISTGSSSLEAVRALKEAGCNVIGMVAIFTYNLPVAVSRFKEADCPLITLTDYEILIGKALKTDYINEDDFKILREFKTNLSK
ncbi:MAG TPA: orotate phosphoribosyltransferase [Bacteroidales bacterium]|nr:orotate phosphoribosyltransferase [Bacteroidales bacterium]